MRLRPVRLKVWRIYAVCSERGNCELLDFLEGLEGQLAKNAGRMRDLLNRVSESGPPRNTEISHDLDKRKGIWEFIQGDLRVLWFYDEGKLIICSHGIVKKQRRTPRSEIDRACRTFDAYTDAKARRQLLFEREEEK
jgi:Phage derived protein Gp49-like (DUF891)